MADPPLVCERAPTGCLRLLLNRPARRNALDEPTAGRLIEELDADPEAVVLLGSTDPTIFSAGADLDISDAERARLSDLLYECYERIITRMGPVIAVVEGPAVGGGAQLATAADLRIAGPGARFRWVGPEHGLAVGAWVLPSLVGRGIALDLTMTGRWVDSAGAHRLGIVPAVDDQPWAAAERIAGQLLHCDAAALARIKQISNAGLLVDRLAEERRGNRNSWPGMVPGERRPAGAWPAGKVPRWA